MLITVEIFCLSVEKQLQNSKLLLLSLSLSRAITVWRKSV